MADLAVKIDGRPVAVPEGTSVAVAMYLSGSKVFRHSVTGQPRAPLCGMGICFECCVTVDGARNIRSCMTPCREGMEVSTR
jgi:predicted molibdopterin-dependent oxidoreductase YjgC